VVMATMTVTMAPIIAMSMATVVAMSIVAVVTAETETKRNYRWSDINAWRTIIWRRRRTDRWRLVVNRRCRINGRGPWNYEGWQRQGETQINAYTTLRG
jgi:hypothetical protein